MDENQIELSTTADAAPKGFEFSAQSAPKTDTSKIFSFSTTKSCIEPGTFSLSTKTEKESSSPLETTYSFSHCADIRPAQFKTAFGRRSDPIPIRCSPDRLPEVPQMSSQRKRMNTFDEWPWQMSQSPEECATSGFYYLGTGDHLKCFWCGIVIKDWESGEVVNDSHLNWSDRRCAFAVNAEHIPRCEENYS